MFESHSSPTALTTQPKQTQEVRWFASFCISPTHQKDDTFWSMNPFVLISDSIDILKSTWHFSILITDDQTLWRFTPTLPSRVEVGHNRWFYRMINSKASMWHTNSDKQSAHRYITLRIQKRSDVVRNKKWILWRLRVCNLKLEFPLRHRQDRTYELDSHHTRKQKTVVE